MSLFYGFLLAAFLLFDIMIFVAFVVYLGNRSERMRGGKNPDSAKDAAHSLGFAVAIEFAVVWSAFVLFFDYIMYVRDAAKQLQTWRYVAVEGEVLKCDVIIDEDSKRLRIEYVYRVQGQEYHGSVVRHLLHWSDSSRNSFVAEHPPQSEVIVFHDPDEPDAAVLIPGLGGIELLVPMILLPFNLVMLAFWVAGLAYTLHGKRAVVRLWSGVRFLEGSARVRLTSVSPIAGATITVGLTAIPAFLVVVIFSGASVSAAVSAWAVVLCSGMVIYAYMAKRADSGRFDLVIDRLSNTLTLPQTMGRREAVHVPLAQLLAVDVASVSETESGPHYPLTLRWGVAGGATDEAKVVDWYDEERSQELAAWIRANAGLMPVPTQ